MHHRVSLSSHHGNKSTGLSWQRYRETEGIIQLGRNWWPGRMYLRRIHTKTKRIIQFGKNGGLTEDTHGEHIEN